MEEIRPPKPPTRKQHNMKKKLALEKQRRMEKEKADLIEEYKNKIALSQV